MTSENMEAYLALLFHILLNLGVVIPERTLGMIMMDLNFHHNQRLISLNEKYEKTVSPLCSTNLANTSYYVINMTQ
jgi:hypothetical protein